MTDSIHPASSPDELSRAAPQASALLRAITAAYTFVALADGQMDHREENRFLKFIENTPELGPSTLEDARVLWAALTKTLRADYATGVDIAHREIRRMVGLRSESDLVVRAAQIAIVADGTLVPAEEAALRRICSTLGVNSESH